MSRFSKVLGGLTEGFREARFRAALNRLSDRQLEDIGLSRANISVRALELAQNR